MIDFTDLRSWMEGVEALGELATVHGADWRYEIGAVTDTLRTDLGEDCPALLFDRIEGYPPGFRVLTNVVDSVARTAFTLGLELGRHRREWVEEVWERLGNIKPLPPVEVETGPLLENVATGADVDLYRFPAPHWHEKDGGRYLGTADCVITRSPTQPEWVNMGTYRVSLIDAQHLFVYISPGKHGALHRDGHLERGEECPVAICCGEDPLLWLMSNQALRAGASELEYAGGLRGEPVEVVRGPVTGLPLPARAEIVIEGFITPDKAIEGPFGEWTGYYASGSRPEYVVRVEAMYHRNDPIILGDPPGTPPHTIGLTPQLFRSAMIKHSLEAAGVPGVKDVYVHPQGGARFFVAISIEQLYPGHARQVLMAAASGRGVDYLGKYIVVVDDDIDVFDLDNVLWALFTRTDPVHSITFAERMWSGPLDPAIPPEHRGMSSRGLIDACRPWEWRDRFPEPHAISADLRARVQGKWPELWP